MHKFLKIVKACSFIAFLFVTSYGMAQKANDRYTPDARLYDCMNKEYLQQLIAEKSELIPYYNYYLDHSFYVVDLKGEKATTGIDIHSVTFTQESGVTVNFNEKVYNSKTFNVLKYNFERKLDGFVTYVWKEAGIALVFYPIRHFKADYDNYMKNNIEE